MTSNHWLDYPPATVATPTQAAGIPADGVAAAKAHQPDGDPMTTLFEHTDYDGDRVEIYTLNEGIDGDDVGILAMPHDRTSAGVYANRADLVAALGAVTGQEFADMSALAKKNLARYETALAERDRARDLAARLEAENARLRRDQGRKQFDDAIVRRLTEAEGRRFDAEGAPVPDLTAVTERLDAILTAVQELRPRVAVRNVEYRTTGNVADIVDALNNHLSDHLSDLGHV